ncbi:MAG: hypothetical protein ACYCOX_05200, partial [Acidobacteriaceae bacterium]
SKAVAGGLDGARGTALHHFGDGLKFSHTFRVAAGSKKILAAKLPFRPTTTSDRGTAPASKGITY